MRDPDRSPRESTLAAPTCGGWILEERVLIERKRKVGVAPYDLSFWQRDVECLGDELAVEDSYHYGTDCRKRRL
jgi:hypothetical protein